MDSLLIDIRTLVLYNNLVFYQPLMEGISWNHDYSKRTRLLIFCKSADLSLINWWNAAKYPQSELIMLCKSGPKICSAISVKKSSIMKALTVISGVRIQVSGGSLFCFKLMLGSEPPGTRIKISHGSPQPSTFPAHSHPFRHSFHIHLAPCHHYAQ